MSNASSTKREQATIINCDRGGEPLKCLFNPTAYTFEKTNEWSVDPTPAGNIPKIEFNTGSAATLQMELLFDTYSSNTSGGSPEDVRKVYTDKLWELMMVDESLRDPKSGKARPPVVRFQWGKTWTFEAVITSLSQRFTLFHADGTPVRAVVNVTFKQVKDEKQLRPQNPTSGGEGGERVWRVAEGDTLAWVAYQSYGDATRWRPIAAANDLRSVRDLRPGSVLLIPNR